MAEALYASFTDPSMAEKAVGALMDHGMRQEDISLLRNTDYGREQEGQPSATHGVSTTTGADAAKGAEYGVGVGAVVGILAGIASLVIPGFGIVIGGGALATAIGAAIGTTAAGAIVGGATGFLRDLGVPEAAAQRYNENLVKGGALLQLNLPSGEVDRAQAEQILNKYQANDVGSYARGMPQERSFPRPVEQPRQQMTSQAESQQASIYQQPYQGESTQPMRTARPQRLAMGRPYSDLSEAQHNEFQQSFSSRYLTEQGRYEDYLDAYQYGYTLGNDDRFRAQGLPMVEQDIRADWEAMHPGTWERFKVAIKDAFDRAAGRV